MFGGLRRIQKAAELYPLSRVKIPSFGPQCFGVRERGNLLLFAKRFIPDPGNYQAPGWGQSLEELERGEAEIVL